MIKDLAVKWRCRDVEGAMKAAVLLADVLVQAGKYSQAFSPAWCERPRSPGIAYNRISDNPIKLHCEAEEVHVDVFLDMESLKFTHMKEGGGENTVYIINSTLDAEYIKEKFNLENNKVITIDSGNVTPAYILFMAAVVFETRMLAMPVFLEILTTLLTRNHDSDSVREVIEQVEQLVTEVEEE